MLQKKEPGCPLGVFDAILLDRFRENGKDTNYGYLPWYSSPGSQPFPDGLCLITTFKRFSFDIRSDSSFFYVVSSRFVEAFTEAGGVFEDCKQVEVRSQRGALLALQYHVCRFTSHDVDEVSRPDLMECSQDEFLPHPKRLEIRDDFKAPVFKVKKLSARVNLPFCSEAFRKIAQRMQLRGIQFENAHGFNWPAAMPFAQEFLAVASGKLPIRLPL